jgi:hypothetical protein
MSREAAAWKEKDMKRFVGPFVAAVAALVFVGAGVAWAGSDSHHVKVTLGSPAVLAGKTLPAGHYTFAWKGNGPEVNVTVSRDGKIMDTTQAKLVKEATKARYQERITRREPSGAPLLEQLQFRGKRTALVFKNA